MYRQATTFSMSETSQPQLPIASPKMTLAVERVLATPELLEAILIQLTPINQLLCAQLISRLFHTTIASSPILQQLLFFRADTARDAKDWSVNPLLRQHFLPWFAGPSEGSFGSRDYNVLKLMDWTTSPLTLAAFLRPEASWRNMLLMQPPPKELQVVRWVHGQGGDSENVATVSFADKSAGAVTMGRVYDIMELYLRWDFGSFASFGVGFDDGEMGPEMTLYLRMTQQCCPSDSTKATLKSEGAEITKGLDWEKRVEDVLLRVRRRLKMEWFTQLTEERGGVGKVEWEEWKKARQARVEKS